jgi:hypothetical protein
MESNSFLIVTNLCKKSGIGCAGAEPIEKK